MDTAKGRFAFDWWVVQKKAVYLVIAIFVALLLVAGAALYVWKYGNPLRDVGKSIGTNPGARFIAFEGDVRVIRAATRETLSASSEIQLYPGDTIQTQANGRARVGMADGSTLVVRPNSTITIRDNASSAEGKKTSVHVVVDNGQMFVRTEQQPEGGTNVVETPKTKSKLGNQTGASFGVNPEGTEEIRVNAGVIETTNRAGETTSLQGGQYVSVNPAGTVSRPQRLLEVPTPSEPRDLENVYVGSNGSANINLKWNRPSLGMASYYRVEVATSPFFVSDGKVIERDQLASTEFTASDLRPGTYFWRVRATASTGQTSDWSEPQKFMVATRGSKSNVPVSHLVAEHIGGSIYLVRGKSDPGTTIRIGGRQAIAAPNGMFQLQITAPAGATEITVEGHDTRGNSSQYRLSLAAGRRG